MGSHRERRARGEARAQDGGQGEDAGGRDVEEAWPIHSCTVHSYTIHRAETWRRLGRKERRARRATRRESSESWT